MAEKKQVPFLERVMLAQSELKAPKNQYNRFGKFYYRSAEDVLEAVKPVNKKHDLLLTITDEVVMVGDRVYVKAIAKLLDIKGDGELVVEAFARESLSKKGMDDSQVSGTASTYARKYAVNGLYLIDDNKDADTDEHRNVQEPPAKATQEQMMRLIALAQKASELYDVELTKIKEQMGIVDVMDVDQYGVALTRLNEALNKKAQEEKKNDK